MNIEVQYRLGDKHGRGGEEEITRAKALPTTEGLQKGWVHSGNQSALAEKAARDRERRESAKTTAGSNYGTAAAKTPSIQGSNARTLAAESKEGRARERAPQSVRRERRRGTRS